MAHGTPDPRRPGHAGSVEFRALGDDEARALLARLHVGRLAFARHDRVDIEPVHYVFDADWIHGRTSLGTKLATLAHHPWCAFEVDDVRGQFEWDSVVVHGTFYLLHRDGADRNAYEHTLAMVRTLVPHALEADDPTPHRTMLFRIHAHDITGRSARSRART